VNTMESKKQKPKPKKKSLARRPKDKKTVVRIWGQGALRPCANAEEVHETLLRGAIHTHALTEIERVRLRRYRAIRRESDAAIAEAEAAYEVAEQAVKAAYEAIKESRVTHYRRYGEKKRQVPQPLLDAAEAAKEVRKEKSEAVKKAVAAFEKTLSLARAERKRRKDAAIAKLPPTKSGKPSPHRLKEINARLRAEMMQEPQWPAAWKLLEEVDEEAYRQVGLADRRRGFNSKTAGLVAEAFKFSKRDSAKSGGPKHHSFRGDGRVGGQVNCSVPELLTKGCSFMRVEKQSQEPVLNPRTGLMRKLSKHHYQDHLVHLLVGTRRLTPADQIPADRKEKYGPFGKQGVDWKTTTVTFPVRFHRELPPEAMVQKAWVLIRRVGERYDYKLQLTLDAEREHFPKPKKRDPGHGRVAVNFGWRQRPDGGVRVAYWVSEFGTNGEIVVPNTPKDGVRTPGVEAHTLSNSLQKPYLLDGFADAHFMDFKRVLRLWQKHGRLSFGAQNRLVNDHHVLRDVDRRRLGQICTQWATFLFGEERLAALWQKWKKERRARKRDFFASLMLTSEWIRAQGASTSQERLAWYGFLWARKDRHLTQYSVDQARRSHRQRDAFYRTAAIELARTFNHVVVDNAKISELAKRKEPDKVADEAWEKARRNRHLFAPGRCREIVRDVFGPFRTITMEAARNSSHCALCGTKLKTGKGDLIVSCKTHGPVDVDHNNCLNLLRRADAPGPVRGQSGDDDEPGVDGALEEDAESDDDLGTSDLAAE
jgi:hypothetical protein